MPEGERTEARVLAELADVESYLRQAPPHAGHGVRESLEARRDRLRRELATLRRRRR